MIEQSKIPDVQKCCESHFHLDKQLEKVKDNRDSVQVETSTGAEAIRHLSMM